MSAMDILTKNPWPRMAADAAQAGLRVAVYIAFTQIEALDRDRGGLSLGAVTLRENLRRLLPEGYDEKSGRADLELWEARVTETDQRPFPFVSEALLVTGLTRQEQDRTAALAVAAGVEVVATGPARMPHAADR